jgi:hypothetical protein
MQYFFTDPLNILKHSLFKISILTWNVFHVLSVRRNVAVRVVAMQDKVRTVHSVVLQDKVRTVRSVAMQDKARAVRGVAMQDKARTVRGVAMQDKTSWGGREWGRIRRCPRNE